MTRPWAIGAINVATGNELIAIPGWTNGTFGIDWRASPAGQLGFVISHIHCGWSLCAMLANLEEVQGFVDLLMERFHWEFVDIAEARVAMRARSAELRPLLAEYGGFNPGEMLVPPQSTPGMARVMQ